MVVVEVVVSEVDDDMEFEIRGATVPTQPKWLVRMAVTRVLTKLKNLEKLIKNNNKVD